ncbi:YigZ family protein [Apibacter muscae]|uniref:YigZ family protein n=1 Tax=Apibacter muscae TaxID=2509004 RepID=A0A563D9M9_9FLAO|nr:YigZ family protein [Apibacter muscae]TWP26769.1 YigZ family protein [Apibacter muscae]TWP27600.1 YigZ family protein [Apibacter muscae]
MSEIFQYRTIDKPITNFLLRIKGSKFYGLLLYMENENDLNIFLQKSKDLYPQATHYCYAYRIGVKGEKFRVNDDGEPSGTAGLPIYNQLLSADIVNVLLIVVRYYGGTKLGVSGLIKAYKECSLQTISQSNIIEKEIYECYELIFNYDKQSLVMNFLKKLQIEPISFNFLENCSVKIKVPVKKRDSFLDKFNPLFLQKFVSYKLLA